MPKLLPQSPALVGAVPDAVPAITMSRKSQSLAARVPTVNTRAVPTVSDNRKTRLIGEPPVMVSVPLMIWAAAKLTVDSPVVDGALIVKLLNVFVPYIVGMEAVDEKIKL